MQTPANINEETLDSSAGAGPQVRQAWWLATRRRRDEWQTLTATGHARFVGRARSHFESAQPGDTLLIYVARPDQAIRAVGVITQVGVEPGEVPNTPDAPTTDGDAPPATADKAYIEVQFAFEVTNPLPWHDIALAPLLAEAEPVRVRSNSTLLYLTPAEYRVLQDLLIRRNPELAPAFAALDGGRILRPGDGGEADPDPPAEGSETRLLRDPAPAYSAPPPPPPGSPPPLPAVPSLAHLAEMTLLPTATLQEMAAVLDEAGQIILSGPPGTGKTWLARGLAVWAAGDPARVQVVQFHPATTYEDFIEGLKPQVDLWGRVTYAVLPGLFLRFCARARNDPGATYTLVIDEINRAPLSRVFGELLYALEYRGPQGAVELTAGGGAAQPFYVPPNLRVIGTMNSADRSIALVDYALRRRFRFLELEPDPAILDGWLARHAVPAATRLVVLDLFRRLNARLTEALGPDYRLGHTYFMRAPFNAAVLARLWRTALRPLLAEYFVPPGGEIEEYSEIVARAETSLAETAPSEETGA